MALLPPLWQSVGDLGPVRVRPMPAEEAGRILVEAGVEPTGERVQTLREHVEAAALAVLHNAEAAAGKVDAGDAECAFWAALERDPAGTLDREPPRAAGAVLRWLAHRDGADLESRKGCLWARDVARRMRTRPQPRGRPIDAVMLTACGHIEAAAQGCGIEWKLGHKDEAKDWRPLDAEPDDPRPPPPHGLAFALRLRDAIEAAATPSADAATRQHLRAFGTKSPRAFVVHFKGR